VTARIVAARPAHLDGVAGIYAEAARTSVATFDLDGPPTAYWQQKLDAAGHGDHFLVATAAGAGTVLGFAYSGWFRTRPAYAGTRETSIYLQAAARGQGLGRRLYEVLLDRLRADGMHLAVAVVATPNPASVALHEALGFRVVGTFREIGHKFGGYVDTTWYQLPLAG
jgi:L-amino acid N-acyltransferase YncA